MEVTASVIAQPHPQAAEIGDVQYQIVVHVEAGGFYAKMETMWCDSIHDAQRCVKTAYTWLPKSAQRRILAAVRHYRKICPAEEAPR